MFRSILCALTIVGFASLALAQGDLNDAYAKLKAADEQKDNEQVKKFAIECLQLSNKVLNSPHAGESDAEVAKTNQALAKDVKTYAEYSLDTAILRVPEPEKKVELFEILEKESPNSKYLPQLYRPILQAYAKMKPDKSFAFAQRVIAKDPNSEELLLVLTAGSYDRKQYDAAANYGTRLAKIMATHARPPEGVSAADWERTRTMMQGRGYWLAGMAYAAQGKYPQAAENLKASLPFVSAEHELTAGAQFTIGLADYNVARVTQDRALMMEALKYSQMAATTSSPYSKQAAQNAYAIKNELARWR